MELSIAMIVKNEEKNLERTLIPLKELTKYIDMEIIIIDTGSTDKSISIAQKYSDKVYCHEWNDDFGAMRNISLNYCTGKWIMVLDADEVLYDVKELISFIKNNKISKYNSATIKIINFSEDVENSIKNGFVSSMLRLFKNNHIRYEGRIHEQPKFELPVLDSNVRVIHYGYNNSDYELMEYKFKRNIELLFKEYEKSENDVYIIFQIAVSYTMHKEYSKALHYIEIAYKKVSKQKERYLYVIDKYCFILYNLRYYEELGDKAQELIKYANNFLDAYFYLGEACYFQKEHESAIKYYNEYCNIYGKTQKDPIIVDRSISVLTRVYKDRVLYNLAISFYRTQKHKKAVDAIKKISDDKIIKEKLFAIFKIIVEGELLEDINIIEKYIDKYNYEDVLMYIHAEQTIEILEKVESYISQSDFKSMICVVKEYKKNGILSIENMNKIKQIMREKKNPYKMYIYYLLKSDLKEIIHIVDYGRDILESIFTNLCSNIFDFNKTLLKALDENYICSLEHNIKATIAKSLILGGNLPSDKKKEIFIRYIYEKYYAIIKMYKDDTIRNKLWILSTEERFIIELKNALSYKYVDTIEYIKKLKEIISVYKIYVDYIKIIVQEDMNFENNNTFKELVVELIKSVKCLIDDCKYQEAYNTINEALSLVKFDFELILLKYNLLLKFNHNKDANKCLRNIVLYGENEKVLEFINRNDL
ncbi:glycosyltransferase [Clostridium beijerinckii]|uniref:glycosyltransferase n=1 Tax=Clostridium beijerinckii TaxID=1520 RepID=UPI0022262EC5|nr:glycosyltransferase [Clostridium beijerinckii]UYZ34262.1 glycosyltransferase [Clostridium beijerinckii]